MTDTKYLRQEDEEETKHQEILEDNHETTMMFSAQVGSKILKPLAYGSLAKRFASSTLSKSLATMEGQHFMSIDQLR